jgi:guanosine-3',5'-bis(diphosphate) 3'-pyrophosphohydrolase
VANPVTEAHLLEAVAFAAKAHRHHLRKDQATPYVSHVFRVCLVLRHIFGVDDLRLMIVALLHDTIEDTTTDFDDIEEHFGTEVAQWVAILSKDKRQPDEPREIAYDAGVFAGGWPIHMCKLADLYDNLSDMSILTPAARKRTLARTRKFLNEFQQHVHPNARRAFDLVEAVWQRQSVAYGS